MKTHIRKLYLKIKQVHYVSSSVLLPSGDTLNSTGVIIKVRGAIRVTSSAEMRQGMRLQASS